MTDPRRPHLLLLGGSSGSAGPLRSILSELPPDLPATIFVVIHLAQDQPDPTAIFARHTALELELAEDGVRFQPGKVYIAPGDRHLALEDGVMRVFRGPRENGSRPAIDVLFRSAAVHHGARVAAVLLSGALSDGSLGLAAVKRCGGICLVQEPSDASNDEMPRRALLATRVDHCVPVAQMGPLLLDILQRPLRVSPPVPEDLRIEARLALSAAEPLAPMESIDTLGQPASLVCPECNGPLWYVPHGDSYGYRCHVGHAYSPESMLDEQAVALERALWAALRALKERSMLLEQMGQQARERGHTWMSQRLEAQCEEIRQQAAAVHQLLATGIEPQVKAGPEAILATEAT